MNDFNERAKARQAAAQRNAKPLTGIAAGMFAGGTADDADELIAAAMMITRDGQICPAAEGEGE